MQLLTRFSYWRIFLPMSCAFLLLIITTCMQALDIHFVHAAGGSANFSLQPGSFDSGDPSSQSYFIFDADPRKVISSRVRVTNTGNAAGTVLLYAVDATTGSTANIVYPGSTAPRHGVGSWVTLSQSRLTLSAGQSQNVLFNVIVPSSVSAGQHIGGIVAETLSPQSASSSLNGSSVKINLNLKKLYVLPVVVRIPGRVREQLLTSGAWFDSSSPYQRVLINLSNAGNVMISPKGSAIIMSSSGSTMQNTQLDLQAILPYTHIAYPVNIMKNALPPGSYLLRLMLTYGEFRRARLDVIFPFQVRQPGQSIATLATQVVVPGPGNFFSSLAPWQYILAGFALLLVGSALFFWLQKVCALIVNVQQKGRRL